MESANLSPMMRQYMDIKSRHKDHIVFFRLGDFYEMFFEDALLASRELEIALTGRECGLEERALMCGVPHHSSESYIARLIKKGYKVAICEQVEDPAEAKGIVRREVVRVVTPGTLIEENLLDEGSNNFIASMVYMDGRFGFAAADISTGSAHACEIMDEQALKSELSRFSPSEVVFNESFFDLASMGRFIADRLNCSADALPDEDYENPEKKIAAQFGRSLWDLGLSGQPIAAQALTGLISYIEKTQMRATDRLIELEVYTGGHFMRLDHTARRNLELTETMRGGHKKGSLLGVLDSASTAMGRRLLRRYLEQPLTHLVVLTKRHDAVEELTTDAAMLADVREALGGVYDLERLMTRIVYGSAGPRELKSFEQTLFRLPDIKKAVENARAGYLRSVHSGINTMDDLAAQLNSAIVDEPPALLKDGGVIRSDYSAELSELRGLLTNNKAHLAAIESREREATGIKNLKVGFNKVFGYYIEITKSYLELVPDSYIRKQTLVGSERYITEELKELEMRILSAGEQAAALEQQLFDKLRAAVADRLIDIQETASHIAELDVYHSLALVAIERGYCRPELSQNGELIITEGRHPVVETLLVNEPFVPNNTALGTNNKRIAIITGPNMAGKSTYIRQTALIALMAQIGSFVPAKSARIGIIDGIYTRVGASDDLATGQSTFMVEMREVSEILKEATSKSLLILDEVGRGTSTFDGMSIARAMVEYIADPKKLGAKTLFATHYHELTELEHSYDCVINLSTAVKKRGDDITFLRRIQPGGADDSYGIEVSKLAGIPEWIITRAKAILSQLEQNMPVSPRKGGIQPAESVSQLSLGDTFSSEIKTELERIDPNTLTPIEALNLIYKLKSLI